MKLPVSFEEVSYFKNEYRGDLIVTSEVLYYFPHTRVNFARYSEEIGGKDSMIIFEILGNFAPILGTVPLIRAASDKSLKFGKFLKRTFRPTINSPRIKKLHLWQGSESSEYLQKILDSYIEQLKKESLKFDEDSVPKPIRFSVEEIENLTFGMKLKFDAKYDHHDFRVNLLHRNFLKEALKEGGFIR